VGGSIVQSTSTLDGLRFRGRLALTLRFRGRLALTLRFRLHYMLCLSSLGSSLSLVGPSKITNLVWRHKLTCVGVWRP
jgi:hypothetical protein